MSGSIDTLVAERPGSREPRRIRDALIALTIADLRVTKDFTLGGIIKWLLEPVSYMFVYFVLVVTILSRATSVSGPEAAGPSARFYPLFLLCALVPWQYFATSFVGSMFSLQRFSFVITNTPTPTWVLPFVTLATEGANFLIALLLFVPMVVIFDVGVWPAVLWLPVLVLNLVLLVSGPVFLGTVFGLYFPDYRGIVQNLMRAGFFVSSALVPISQVPEEARELRLLLRANPFSGIFDSFRSVFLHGTAPERIDLLIPFVAGVVMLGLGTLLFAWRRREFAKEV